MKWLTLCFVIVLFPCFSQSNQLNEFLLAHESYGRFSGSVILSLGDTASFRGNYGNSTINGLKNSSATSFDIGSLSKQFTAAAIVQLASQGKLKLGDPINQHLKEWGSLGWKSVTIHHLLTHTSGIPSLMRANQGLDKVRPTASEISLPDLINHFRNLPLRSKPGKQFSYSNSGYVLLAAIIEKVSGVLYAQYMQKEMFKKFGLTNTSIGPNSNAAMPHAGYCESNRNELPLLHHSWFIGAGGIYSSAEDLNRWMALLRAGETGWGDLAEEIFKPHIAVNGSKAYGYGWMINKKLNTVEHDGATLGFISRVTWNRSNNITNIILTNTSTDAWETLDWSANYITTVEVQLLSMLNGKTVEMPVSATKNLKRTVSKQFRLNESIEVAMVNDQVQTSSQNGVLGWAYTQPIILSTAQESVAQTVSDLLVQKKFGKLAKFSTSDMRVAIRLGLMRMGFNSMTKQAGKLQGAIVYQSEKGKTLCRFVGEKTSIDFVLYFDEQNKLSGVFETAELPKPVRSVNILPLADGTFLVNGFDHGSTDAIIRLDGTDMVWKQLGREFRLVQAR
jgi:CubicO group peptidase (beta-lactamase class C family)